MPQSLIIPSRQLITSPRGFRKPSQPVLDTSASINRGLVGCWPLGHTAKDISPYGSNGTPSGTPPTAAGHHGGVAMSFNGTTQYITLPNTSQLDTHASKMTIVMWAKWTSNLLFTAGAGGLDSWLLGQIGGAGLTNFGYARWDGGAWKAANAAAAPDGNWHCFAGMWDGTTAYFFQDGVQKASIATATNTTSISSNLIAKEFFSGTLASCTVDIVRLYNRAISASELLRLYAEPYAGIYEVGPRSRVGAVGGGTAYSLAAAAGTYLISGVSAKTVAARLIGAAPGSYVISGAAAKTVVGRFIGANPGTYTINGAALLTVAARKLSLASGSYSISGNAALTTVGRFINAAPGSYVITGAAISFKWNHVLQATPGSYTINGSGAALIPPSGNVSSAEYIYFARRRKRE